MGGLTFSAHILQMPANISLKFRWLHYIFILEEAFVCLILPVKYYSIFAFSCSNNSVTLIHFSIPPMRNKQHMYAYMCVSASVYVHLSMSMHMCVVCVYMFLCIFFREPNEYFKVYEI